MGAGILLRRTIINGFGLLSYLLNEWVRKHSLQSFIYVPILVAYISGVACDCCTPAKLK